MLQKIGKKKNQNCSYSDDEVTNYVSFLKNYENLKNYGS